MNFNLWRTQYRGVVAMAMAFILGIGVISASAVEIDPKEYAVEVSAVVSTNPPQVTLSWPGDVEATGYIVERRLPSPYSWTQIGTVNATDNTFVDGSVTVGSSFEYHIKKTTKVGYVTGQGYILAGINAPLVENRGKVVLIVDDTHASTLALELARLQQDLVGDGWMVLRHDVAPTGSVTSVKGLIKADYEADPANVKAVFLIGHVPVPRSGDILPDGHPTHEGAWPADSYYGEMDGVWTDEVVNTTVAVRSENHNIPGDGKFDQGTIPNDLKLAVGRVDFANMTGFSNKVPSRSEVDLLRQYLNKDHKFRHGRLNLPRRGLVCDNFGNFGGEAFAANGWRSFAPMFGGGTTFKAQPWRFFSTLNIDGYLWSYGAGFSDYIFCDGIGSSDDFALNNIKTSRTTFFAMGSVHPTILR
jgi:hypothetical protein